jgi:hypothetical protein
MMNLEIECCTCTHPIEGKIVSLFKPFTKLQITHASCERCYELCKDNWERNGWKVIEKDKNA